MLGTQFIPALSEREASTQSRVLKALADPTRLRILSLLSRHEGEMCVHEIVDCFDLEQPSISHHLCMLRDAGLIECHRTGYRNYYYVRKGVLTRAIDGLVELL